MRGQSSDWGGRGSLRTAPGTEISTRLSDGAGLQTDDHSLCVRQVLPKAAAATANLNVHQPLRRSLQELNELCRAVTRSQSSTPAAAADESTEGTSRHPPQRHASTCDGRSSLGLVRFGLRTTNQRTAGGKTTSE